MRSSALPWSKGAEGWNEDDHPRQGDGAKNPGWFAGKGDDKDASGIQANQKQANDDKAFPYQVLRLSDGSEVIAYNGKPICIPNDVSLSDNVKLGEVIGKMTSDVRPLICFPPRLSYRIIRERTVQTNCTIGGILIFGILTMVLLPARPATVRKMPFVMLRLQTKLEMATKAENMAGTHGTKL